jgi:hypothetical protein
MYTTVLLPVLILLQPHVSESTPAIHVQYTVIIDEYMARAGTKSPMQSADELKAHLHDRLKSLLQTAESAGGITNIDDLIALSDCCDRLGMRTKATEYAKQAVGRASDTRPYVKLTRLYCAERKMEGAEEVLASAIMRFGEMESDDIRIMHNMLALTYRANQNFGKAMTHFDHTIPMLVSRIPESEFAALHIVRCVEAWQMCATKDGMSEEECLQRIEAVNDKVIMLWEEYGKAHIPLEADNERELTLHGAKGRRIVRAILGIDAKGNEARGEGVLAKWMAQLLSVAKRGRHINEVCHEITVACEAAKKYFNPKWSGRDIAKVCEELESVIGEYVVTDGEIRVVETTARLD